MELEACAAAIGANALNFLDKARRQIRGVDKGQKGTLGISCRHHDLSMHALTRYKFDTGCLPILNQDAPNWLVRVNFYALFLGGLGDQFG